MRRARAIMMDVQAAYLSLTKQIDDRDDCAKLANRYAVLALKNFL